MSATNSSEWEKHLNPSDQPPASPLDSRQVKPRVLHKVRIVIEAEVMATEDSHAVQIAQNGVSLATSIKNADVTITTPKK